MGERRMFNKKITESDAFLDMPASAQMLYFHFSMNADDDGFVNSPRKIQKMCCASDEDYEMLIARSFIILFDSGIIVIKHWRMHNYIKSDRYKATNYVEEKSLLGVKKNNSYTLDESQMVKRCDTNEPVDIKETKKKEVYFPNDEQLEEAFQEFLTMRRKIKKPLVTSNGINRMLNKISRLSEGDNDLAVRILQQSIDHCWTDIYELKSEPPKQVYKNKQEEQLGDLLGDK